MSETQQKRWAGLASVVDMVLVAMALVGVAAVAGGAAMIFAGKLTDDGGMFSDPIVYQIRPVGFVVLALGLLITPPAMLAARAVQVWAQGNAET